eukprot:CAMPEP_0202876838 /NCGR_PEP_ID=MMETSP1391-20130828/29693_1 /ASSEMBLY_ACC=CAM_ASM_000867 /TAXON_ID=1034604 /ORGANISM="Chlamydomonas leiostraca, Strain SAG 11-49" /LENGTH=149 /DNA_ID=CAMNT_0049558769 /DNA_START=39 /DNA_END=484 /DNA_ORIENTATION=-
MRLARSGAMLGAWCSAAPRLTALELAGVRFRGGTSNQLEDLSTLTTLTSSGAALHIDPGSSMCTRTFPGSVVVARSACGHLHGITVGGIPAALVRALRRHHAGGMFSWSLRLVIHGEDLQALQGRQRGGTHQGQRGGAVQAGTGSSSSE